MCRGILSGTEAAGCRRAPLQLQYDELKHTHGWCTKPQAAAAPTGLAIVAAFETELAQSRAATKAPEVRETVISYTSSIPAGTHSLPIPIPASTASANQEEDNNYRMINKFSASDQHCQSNYHNNYRINTRSYCQAEAQKSIFSTALSPPGSTGSRNSTDLRTPPPDFLGACVSCKRPLGPGKDIYMYRGDRAFCSTECRYQHIVADERLSSTNRLGQQHAQTSSSIKESRFTPAATIIVLG